MGKTIPKVNTKSDKLIINFVLSLWFIPMALVQF